MKTTVTTLIFISILGATISAKAPVRYMSPTSLGIEYTSLWRGQNITEAVVPSHEQIQQFCLNYAPVEYIQFLFGLGMDRFEVDVFQKTQFLGNYGFSFSAGAYLNSPAFVVNNRDFLRLTGGTDFLYLNSKDDYDYKYSGPIVNPSVGLLVHAGPYFDIEAGVKWHFIIGTMEYPVKNQSSKFSNNNTMRGYYSMALTSLTGAYFRLNMDVSPESTSNWKDGPVEATIGFSVGFMLETKKAQKKENMEKSEYFPDYEEMRKKQDKMAEEIGE